MLATKHVGYPFCPFKILVSLLSLGSGGHKGAEGASGQGLINVPYRGAHRTQAKKENIFTQVSCGKVLILGKMYNESTNVLPSL